MTKPEYLPIQDLIWQGTDNDEKHQGTEGNDIILARGGDDVIPGLGGNDQIFGGDGKDYLDGGAGNDVIWGDNGNSHPDLAVRDNNDLIYGGDGNDTVFGESGNDTVFGGASGFDMLYGGAGNDILSGSGALYGGDDDDLLKSTGPGAFHYGGAGNDTIDFGRFDQLALAYGGDGNDTITGAAPSGIGGSAGAAAYGDGGNDFISTFGGQAFGGDGNDTIEMRANAMPGAINGGSGDDIVRSTEFNGITTGAGHDHVELVNGFANGSNLEGGHWHDFNAGEDQIGVVGYGFHSYAEFTSASNVSIIQNGSSVIISISGQAALTLENTDLTNLHENNFYFG